MGRFMRDLRFVEANLHAMGKTSTLRTPILGFLLWEILHHLSLALAQPSGFISIDCGSREESYIDSDTNITYFSDSKLMEYGEITAVHSDYIGTRPKHLWHLRTFPKGNRTCYTLQPVTPGTSKYLLRASFFYGNFDGLNSFPQFDLYLENSFVQTVNASVPTDWLQYYEFIVKPSRAYLTLCLCKTNEGDNPFISAIELRPMPGDAIYPVVNQTLALKTLTRNNFGSLIGESYRFPVDVFDRTWFSPRSTGLDSINTTLGVSSTDSPYVPPSVVMQTADTSPSPTGTIMSRSNLPQGAFVFMCIHFAELTELRPNETREFNIMVDSKLWVSAFRPLYLNTTTVCTESVYPSQSNVVAYIPTEQSTLAPIVNALELYSALQFSGSATDYGDASCLVDIRDKYQISKSWTGDPCLPINYTWEGLGCSYDKLSPRVISLDLSNSGLSGQIPKCLENLSAIVNLNLSGNNLTGNIPLFLASLPQLRMLDLSDNGLSGCVPEDLRHKNESGRLQFRLSGNEKLRSSVVCTPHRKQFWKRITIGVTVSAALIILLIAAQFTVIKLNKRNPPGEDPDLGQSGGSVDKGTAGCQVFSYSEVVEITNDFRHKIGEGGFGPVFLGRLHGQDVAVKILSDKSRQGSKEFHTEVALLSRVHHRNLVQFFGYCDEAAKMILIYEYLPKGNLHQALSGRAEVDLDWNQRLQIALNAAQGLEYLHSWCKPAIIHRDVKSANILLNDKLEAKIADFGLSKSGMPDGFSHVSTAVMGTPGYLDPEYSTSCWLNEKSDVYSFGVVFLELISGRLHVLDKASGQRIHIVEWARSNLSSGNHANIADPSLCGKYEVGSLWRAVELALQCAREKGMDRPCMSYVVSELKDAIMCSGSQEIPHQSEEGNLSHTSGASTSVVLSSPAAR